MADRKKIEVKRYMLFQYEGYYPGGGMGDFTSCFDSIEEARKYVKIHNEEFNDLYDRETLEEVVDFI